MITMFRHRACLDSYEVAEPFDLIGRLAGNWSEGAVPTTMAQDDLNLAFPSIPELAIEGETPGGDLDRLHTPVDELLPDATRGHGYHYYATTRHQ